MKKRSKQLTGVLKVCTKCTNSQDTSLFNKNPKLLSGLDSWCLDCKAKEAKKYYWKTPELHRVKAKARSRERRLIVLQDKKDNPGKYLCMLARRRAKVEGIPFLLNPEDIKIPTYCPVLGIELRFSYGKHATDFSPTLDKFIPSLGYIPGNVNVISKRANRLKGDGTLQEIEALLNWMRKGSWFSTF